MATLFKTQAKPFLKWAGGKRQLIDQFEKFFPPELETGEINSYVEPFVGSGAVFFHIANNYSQIENFHISDINKELILTYRTIKERVFELIEILKELECKYHELKPDKQQEVYYEIRNIFNSKIVNINYDKYEQSWVQRTSQIIFLNRTCFNGLFRVNSKGEFNVPFGKYSKPKICDEQNLLEVHEILQKAEIDCGDFTKCESYVDENTFVYFDPPYLPISRTANFISYSTNIFNENEQVRLAEFYKLLSEKNAKLMLSNSDPKNIVHTNNFFESHYQQNGISINKVRAFRMINCNGNKRGKINELVITNY